MFVVEMLTIPRSVFLMTRMMIDDFDAASFEYLLEVIVFLLTFLLFLWWAIYKKVATKKVNAKITNPSKKLDENVSVVYLLVMFGFLTQAFATYIGYYTRSIRLSGDIDAYHQFMNSFWWHIRIVPRLIVGMLLSARMVRKVYIEFFQPQKRRRSDRDAEDI
jgi:cyanate permease